MATRTAILLATTAAHTLTTAAATDPDCTAGYSGYALKIGSACSQYVQCANGSISAWMTCANGLLYNGDVGMGGICDFPANVQCKDPDMLNGGAGAGGSVGDQQQKKQQAPAQATVTGKNLGGGQQQQLPAVSSTAADPDCGTAGYTGYALKIGSGCTQYVQCSNGSIGAWMTCANGLMYTGEVGMGGICDWATNVQCKDPEMFNPSPAAAAEQPEPEPEPELYTQLGGNKPSMSNNEVGQGKNENNLSDEMNSIVKGYEEAMMQANQQTQKQEQVPQMDNQQDTMVNFLEQQLGGTTTLNSIPAPEPTLPPWTNAPFAPSPPMSKTVIGYYAGWQWYDRNKFADPNNIDFSKYDRINYAFFQPDINGRLFGTDSWGDPQILWGPYIYDTNQQTQENYFCSWDGPNESDRNCAHHDISRGLINRAHAVGTKVMPSIGGWTLSDNFPGIAADPYKRDLFADQCVELIEAYGFDGIDLDWEYPGYEDHSGTPEDTVNFTLLLRAIRTKLDTLGNQRGKYYGLTAALPCGPDKIDKIQVSQIANILDELNLMSYDLHGAWDALTGTNAPMYDQGWTDETPRWSVHGCVNNYVELGVPLSRMNIGLPFYGRSFQGATGMKQFHGGADDINYHLDEGSPQYFNIVNELKRMTTWRHEKTQTQYAVFNQGGGLVSYDDPRAICDKVGYANERGMHGFLIWEISGDMLDNGSTPLIDTTNNKIQNPNLDCSTLRDPISALNDSQYRYAPDEPASVDWSQYNGPMSTGSGNDFNGAGEGGLGALSVNRPLLDGNWNMNDSSPLNSVFQASDSSSSNGNDSANNDCPLDFTGPSATAGCKGYVYCTDGQVTGGVLPCVPGTLFDISIGVCTWETEVTCGN